MSTVTVSRMGARLVAAKRAEGDSTATLRAEARVLQALDHPGLVQFVDVTEDDGTVVMRTAFAGTDTWASYPALDSAERAVGIAAVAATLADLHARGVTHGSLSADHVIWGDHGRPVLCGLSRCRGDDEAARHADLVALAELIEQPKLDGGSRSGALGALANRIRNGHLEATDVVEMANRIASDPRRGPVHNSFGARQAFLAGAVLVLVAGASIAVVGAGARTRIDPTVARSVTELTGRPDPSSPAAPPVPSTPPSVGDAEGGPDLPFPEPGPEPVTVDHGGRRYALGRGGDVVAIGDWDCDGIPTAAILRPASGEVAVFANWPDAGRSTEASWSEVVEGAQTLEVASAAGCDQLRVHTEAGSELVDVGSTP